MANFYTFLHQEKSNYGFSMSIKKIPVDLQEGILEENQLKDKYLTKRMEMEIE